MNLDIFGLEISLRKLINSILYLIFVFIIYLIIRKILKTTITHAGGKKVSPSQRQRIKTVSQMVSSILKYFMLILVLLVILADFGVNVSSLIAGLGILTAVLGLAFQDMIKDFIAGITIITEDQFGVGDVVEVDGFKGTVISVGLKTTEIKSIYGQVKIIANHNIDGLINYSKFDSIALVEVRTSYETSPAKVISALSAAGKHVARSRKLSAKEIIITPASDDLEENGIAYQMTCPCNTNDASDVQSLMRESILAEFKKQKIKIPYQQVIIHNK